MQVGGVESDILVQQSCFGKTGGSERPPVEGHIAHSSVTPCTVWTNQDTLGIVCVCACACVRVLVTGPADSFLSDSVVHSYKSFYFLTWHWCEKLQWTLLLWLLHAFFKQAHLRLHCAECVMTSSAGTQALIRSGYGSEVHSTWLLPAWGERVLETSMSRLTFRTFGITGKCRTVTGEKDHCVQSWKIVSYHFIYICRQNI